MATLPHPAQKQTNSFQILPWKKPQLGSSCWNLATISTESLAKCRYDQGGSYLKAALSAGLAWKRRLTEPSGTQIGWKQLALQDERSQESGEQVLPGLFLPCCFCRLDTFIYMDIYRVILKIIFHLHRLLHTHCHGYTLIDVLIFLGTYPKAFYLARTSSKTCPILPESWQPIKGSVAKNRTPIFKGGTATATPCKPEDFGDLQNSPIPCKMGVSKNRDTPKWMVYNEKPYWNWMIWGYHYFWKDPDLSNRSRLWGFSTSFGERLWPAIDYIYSTLFDSFLFWSVLHFLIRWWFL